ncbi:hypothetical protein [Lolliginicoccus suaedae]|uniref:hypothetical protein n=1 Tax=Lolliginicoccus suaedae TaxID=2605429 RepID=UPI0011ECEBC0|nr:hypothetical protein [Lolliginicoccus suaedae]
MKSMTRATVAAAASALIIAGAPSVASAQDLSSTLSIGSMELISLLDVYTPNYYYPYYGYGWAGPAFDLGETALTGTFGLLGQGIGAIGNIF